MQIDIETEWIKTNGAKRWMVWFSIEGDLRFLSHRNVMNLCERAAARAGLPVAFSRGFNPHPKISLLLPRPVGVASRCELLIIGFERVIHDARWLERFSKQFPPSAKVLRAEPMPDKSHIWVKSVTYRLPLTDIERKVVLQYLAEMKGNRSSKNGQIKEDKNIKNYIIDIDVFEDALTFTIAGNRQTSPVGPNRVLKEIGFTEPSEVIARLIRTRLVCQISQGNL